MNNYSIEQVVPHDAPMILIEQLAEYSDETSTCSVTITPQSPFYNEQIEGVPSYIGIEYMAQSIAAYAGALANDINEAVRIGFLIGTRKYKTHQAMFYKNSTLTIYVHKLYQDESKKILCDAKINVFQPEDPLEFIRENQ